MTRQLNRREFIRDVALFSAMGVAPQFLTRTVEGASRAIQGFKDNRVLVVVQLGGGNDGLNTLVPYSDDVYHRLRPRLALKNSDLIKLNDDLAFNARLKGLMELYDDGALAVIQGVGYPNPDRSHFRSTEIWQTASDADTFESTGWIGRYFDQNCSGTARPQVGVAIGKSRPQAFDGARGFGIAFENPDDFGWQPGNARDTESNFLRLNSGSGATDSNLDFLRHVTSNAVLSSREVRRAIEGSSSGPPKGNPFRRQLDTVATLIKGGLDTRIYFVSVTGFDTHANQLGQHNALLERVGRALADFQKHLRRDKVSEHVVTMIFSEFGRRVAENHSGGTDHGTAAPMFLVGDAVRPGLHGVAPDLSRLDNGDLKYSTDFRSVYATVLKNWLGVQPEPVLNGSFETLDLIG